jgi:hypothetical protein
MVRRPAATRKLADEAILDEVGLVRTDCSALFNALQSPDVYSRDSIVGGLAPIEGRAPVCHAVQTAKPICPWRAHAALDGSNDLQLCIEK